MDGAELSAARPDRLHAAAWCAAIVAALLMAHPYRGITHDNILYVAQALSRLYPEVFLGDVYFQWGSQDRYSFFSPIYSTLIRLLGLDAANLSLSLASLFLFLGGSYALVRALLPAGRRVPALAFIACSIGVYGGMGDLHMVETFVTPRLAVQAATLFALALLVSGRPLASLALLVAGALLHPLIALAGALYWWLYLVIGDRRWLWLLLLALVPAGAGLAGVAPFTQLFQSFDAAWLAPIHRENPMLFVSDWRPLDASLLVFDLAMLSMGAVVAPAGLRRALAAALATAAAALAITLVAVDGLNNVLITNLQPWRALWIVHWMALVALAAIALHLWEEGGAGRIVAALCVLGFVSRGSPVSVVVSLAAAGLFACRHRLAPDGRQVRVVLYVIGAGALANWATAAVKASEQGYEAVDVATDAILRALSLPLPILAAVALVAWLVVSRPRDARTALLAAAALLALAVIAWDRRTPYSAYLESEAANEHPFRQFVAPDKQVLWNWDLTAVWVLMRRRSYFSSYQHAGQMFSRETAMELARRKALVAPLRGPEGACAFSNRLRKNDYCRIAPELVRDVCRAAPDIDYVVTETRFGERALAEWTPPVELPFRVHYYLYDCKRFSAG